MQVSLEVSHKSANVRRVAIRTDAVIGRSRDCNLRIASSSISRRHCQIRISKSGVLVRDLGSSNGTFINGVRIPPGEDVPAPPDAELALGGVTFLLRYALPMEPGSTVEFNPSEPGESPAQIPSSEIELVDDQAQNVIVDDESSTTGDSVIIADGASAVLQSVEHDVAASGESTHDPEPIAPALPVAAAADDEGVAAEEFRLAAGESAQPESFSAEAAAPAEMGGLLKSLFGLFVGRRRDSAPVDAPVAAREPAQESIEADQPETSAAEQPAGEAAETADADGNVTSFLANLDGDDPAGSEPADDGLSDFLKQLK